MARRAKAAKPAPIKISVIAEFLKDLETTSTIKPELAAKCLKDEGLDWASIQETEGGFHILLSFYGRSAKPLGLARGNRARAFKTFSAAAKHMIRLEIERFKFNGVRNSSAPKSPLAAELLEAEAFNAVSVDGVEGGFRILYGPKSLMLSRGNRERVFKTFRGAANHLKRLGIGSFRVNVEYYLPPPKPKRRSKASRQSDAAERTEEADAYDAFFGESAEDFYESIEEAIAQVDAGTAVLLKWTKEDSEKAIASGIAKRKAKIRGSAQLSSLNTSRKKIDRH